jgi:hypothetical protein
MVRLPLLCMNFRTSVLDLWVRSAAALFAIWDENIELLLEESAKIAVRSAVTEGSIYD